MKYMFEKERCWKVMAHKSRRELCEAKNPEMGIHDRLQGKCPGIFHPEIRKQLSCVLLRET